MFDIPQDDRVCSKCERKFLSGIVHIDRAHTGAMLCLDCAQDAAPEMWKQLRAASNAKWADHRKAAEAGNA